MHRETKSAQLHLILASDQPTHESLATHILTSIDAWMRDLPLPEYDHVLHHNNPYLHAALATQEIIGWENFLKTRFSRAWLNCFTYKTNTTNAKPPHQVLSKVAKWVWTLFLDTWKNRNTIVFGDNNQNTSDVHHQRLNARISKLYTACNQLPLSSRQHHQYKPLAELLKSKTSTLTLWQTQAEQTLAEHRKQINKGLPQNLITRYFAPITGTPIFARSHGT